MSFSMNKSVSLFSCSVRSLYATIRCTGAEIFAAEYACSARAAAEHLLILQTTAIKLPNLLEEY